MLNILITDFEDKIFKLTNRELKELVINIKCCIKMLPQQYIKESCLTLVLIIVEGILRDRYKQ